MRHNGKISKLLKIPKPQTQAPKKKFKPNKKKFSNSGGHRKDKGKGGKHKRK